VGGFAHPGQAAVARQGGSAPVSQQPYAVVPPVRGQECGGAAPRVVAAAAERDALWRHLRRWGGAVESLLVAVEGDAVPADWHLAAAGLVARHPVTRSRFGRRSRSLVERPGMPPTPLVPCIDLAALAPGRALAAARAAALREADRPFDVAAEAPLRLRLFRLGAGRVLLGLTVHRLVADRSTARRWLHELRDAAQGFAIAPERVAAAGPGGIEGGSKLRGAALERWLAFWRPRLGGRATQPALPYDRPRRSVHRLAVHPVEVAPELAAGLRELASDCGAAPAGALLAVLAGLLRRYGNRDLLIAVTGPGEESLPVSISLPPTVSARELVVTADAAWREARRQPRTPAYLIADRLGLAPADERRTLVAVALHVGDVAPPDAEDNLELVSGELASHELVLELAPRTDGGMAGRFAYNGERFEAATVARLAGHWSALLAACVRRPGDRLNRLPMLAGGEWRRLTADGAEAARPISGVGRPLHERIGERAAASPEAPAVCSGEERLDYRGLWRRSTALAARLRRHGAAPGRLVAVLMGRGLDLPVALLAVLRSGAAYLPLDPAVPAERNRAILAEAQPAVVLCDGARRDAVADRFRTLTIESPQAGREDEPASLAAAPDVAHLPAVPLVAPAYRIYTSGTSGVPNGVAVTHRNLLQAILSHQLHYGAAVERMLLFPPIAFDSSVVSLFWTLADGGCLVVPDDDEQRDPTALEGLIARHRVTHWLSVPSAYRALLQCADAARLATLRVVVVAGEECPPSLVARHRRSLPDTLLYNEYGPTEGSVWCSVHRCDEADAEGAVSIGRAAPGVRLYNLDSSANPLPAGLEGELFLAGDGVTAGYDRRPRLTAERFLPDPFATRPGERMYRTGDRVRLRPGRGYEYLGRRDRQVKVRGFRIQIEEVEGALLEHPAVREAAVVAWSDRHRDTYLAAYVVASGALPVADLRRHLERRLPAYMVPAAYLFPRSLRRGPNGKVDRKQLPAPGRDAFAGGQGRTPPRSATERRLAALWCEVLELDAVQVEDDFFQCGGHSLLATRLATRIGEAFGVRVPMLRLFEASRLDEMAGEIDEARAAAPRRRPAERPPAAAPAPVPTAEWAIFCLRSAVEDPLLANGGPDGLAGVPPVREMVAPDLRFELDADSAAEEAATEMAAAIRRAQPRGPYRLGGTLDTVPVLLDLAERLEAPGEPPPRLCVAVVDDSDGRRPDDETRSQLALTTAAGGRVLRCRRAEIGRLLVAELVGEETGALAVEEAGA